MNKNKTKRKLPYDVNIFWPGGELPTIDNGLSSSMTNGLILSSMQDAQNQASINNFDKSLSNLKSSQASVSSGPTLSGLGVANKALGVLGGLSGVAKGFTSNAQITDTSELESDINKIGNTVSTASDTSSLANDYLNREYLDDFSYKDIRGVSGGKQAANIFGSALSGATTGLSVGGPWGALAGAVVGLGTGIGGIFSGKKKAEDKYHQLIEDRDEAYLKRDTALANAGDNIITNRDLMNRAAYISAMGGPIHIKKANRGKFTESADRAGMGVQEYARHILANKEDYSPTLIKRANFARNFGGNRKADGGYLEGSVYDLSELEIKRLIDLGYEIEYIK